jgi:N utilization substance protein B
MRRSSGGIRHRAREVVFRVAYQADVTGDSYGAAWDARRDEEQLNDDQTELVRDVVRTLGLRAGEIDDTLRAAAEHWPLERMSHTDRAVLRCGVAELMARPGTPVRVVLDEAVEIARRFGSDESGRFVNGVLDRVARSLRATEFA